MTEREEPLPWTGSAWPAARGSESCSTLHCSGLSASKAMSDYLCYSLLTVLALKSSIVNDTLQSLSAFLTGIITNQHLQVQNAIETGRGKKQGNDRIISYRNSSLGISKTLCEFEPC